MNGPYICVACGETDRIGPKCSACGHKRDEEVGVRGCPCTGSMCKEVRTAPVFETVEISTTRDGKPPVSEGGVSFSHNPKTGRSHLTTG